MPSLSISHVKITLNDIVNQIANIIVTVHFSDDVPKKWEVGTTNGGRESDTEPKTVFFKTYKTI